MLRFPPKKTGLRNKGAMMEKPHSFDLDEAHRYFSAECFNRAWDYIDKPVRTREEAEKMLLLGMASLWHWTQRSDITPVNLSVGYWQIARIYALLGQADASRQYAQLSLKSIQGEESTPFFLGYAYEALARAEVLAGEGPKADEYLHLARQLSEKISDPQDRKQLLDDLATIKI
jgi:hypothetical protein